MKKKNKKLVPILPEHPDALLQVQDLQVQYITDDGSIYAVNDITFCINKGETVGLVGETGAGKTTTALSILNLLPDPPGKITGGDIFFEGKSVCQMSKHDLRGLRGGKVSMIFQDPMTALNPVESVGDQITEVVRLHSKCSRKEAAERSIDMLEMVGIPGTRYGEYPHQFSGGMKQRVVIAIALACNPMLLIADEPTTALDVTIQAQVLELIGKLQEKFNTAMLLITHDLGVVAEVCDKVMIMYAGEIVESGSLEDIYNQTGHPYTQGLFDSLPDMESDMDSLKSIKGLMPDPSNLPKGCKFAPRCPYCCPECMETEISMKEVASGHLVRCVRYGKIKLKEG